MNAAFLLVTTAWLAGDYHVIQPVSGVVASPSCGANCGGCNTYDHGCCDPCAKKPGLLDRIRAHFNRNKGCNDTCAPTCQPTCTTTCHQPTSCDPCGCDDPCKKKGFLARLKERFGRKKNGCDSCDSCCSTGSTNCAGPSHQVIMPEAGKTPEKLQLPEKKKGAEDANAEPPLNEVRISTPPANPVVVAPSVIVPNAQAATRNPF